MVEVNIRRMARICEMMLESATAHMLAIGPIKNLLAYQLAARVYGQCELIMDHLNDDDPDFERLKAILAKSITIGNQFEESYKVFQVTTESGKQLTVATKPAEEPAEEGAPVRPRRIIHLDKNVKPQRKTFANGNKSHRLEQWERMAIWEHFNGKNPSPKTWREFAIVAEMYSCNPYTIQYWSKNNPSKDVKSM